MSQVIAAISTAPQPGAIGILRLSGDGAIAVADRVFTAASGKPLAQTTDRRLVLGSLHDAQGRVLDQVLATVSRAPHSYTGEDTAELHCHGSLAVLAAGLQALFAAGAQQAGPGEFTKRAFLNGCLDLSQAEAVIDLIEADTAEAAANAAGQLSGAVRSRIDPLYDRLAGLCAHFHAVLDYPDEDIEDFRNSEITETVSSAQADLAALAATYRRGTVLKNGLDAVILGKPNVGKSSLLNALAGYDRVIVTDVAGTTRDAVTEVLKLGSIKLRLTDTAGIRDTDDQIEAMGVERSRQAAKKAKLALCVLDGSRPLDDEDQAAMAAAWEAEHAIALLNKQDLPQQISPADLPFDWVIPLCTKTGEGLDSLERVVEELFPLDLPCDGTLLTNARQAGAVFLASEALERATAALRQRLTPAAVLVDVEEAMELLGQINGRKARTEITDQIFSRFCVGK